jgi:hypothetical protein
MELTRHGWGGLFDSFFDDFTTFPRHAFEKHLGTIVSNNEGKRNSKSGYDVQLGLSRFEQGDFNVSLDEYHSNCFL